MNNTRSKATQNRYGNTAQDYAFNQQAGAYKNLGPILGRVRNMGALNTAKNTSKQGRLVAIYNDSAVTAFAAIGTSNAVAAPTGGTDGICLAPFSYTTIVLLTETWVICNVATCYGYEIEDDLEYNANSGSNS